jgi:hypothetical protein
VLTAIIKSVKIQAMKLKFWQREEAHQRVYVRRYGYLYPMSGKELRRGLKRLDRERARRLDNENAHREQENQQELNGGDTFEIHPLDAHLLNCTYNNSGEQPGSQSSSKERF